MRKRLGKLGNAAITRSYHSYRFARATGDFFSLEQKKLPTTRKTHKLERFNKNYVPVTRRTRTFFSRSPGSVMKLFFCFLHFLLPLQLNEQSSRSKRPSRHRLKTLPRGLFQKEKSDLGKSRITSSQWGLRISGGRGKKSISPTLKRKISRAYAWYVLYSSIHWEREKARKRKEIQIGFFLDGTTRVFLVSQSGETFRIGSKTARSATLRQTQGIDVCLPGERRGRLSRLFSNGTVFCLAENVRSAKIFLDVRRLSLFVQEQRTHVARRGI